MISQGLENERLLLENYDSLQDKFRSGKNKTKKCNEALVCES